MEVVSCKDKTLEKTYNFIAFLTQTAKPFTAIMTAIYHFN